MSKPLALSQIGFALEHQPMTRFQTVAVAICMVLNAIDGFDVLAIAFAAPVLTKEWSLPPEQLGILPWIAGTGPDPTRTINDAGTGNETYAWPTPAAKLRSSLSRERITPGAWPIPSSTTPFRTTTSIPSTSSGWPRTGER